MALITRNLSPRTRMQVNRSKNLLFLTGSGVYRHSNHRLTNVYRHNIRRPTNVYRHNIHHPINAYRHSNHRPLNDFSGTSRPPSHRVQSVGL